MLIIISVMNFLRSIVNIMILSILYKIKMVNLSGESVMFFAMTLMA